MQNLLRGNYSNGVPVQFVVGPYASGVNEMVAIEITKWPSDAMLAIGGASSDTIFVCRTPLKWPCTTPNTRRFQRVVGSNTPAFQFLRPLVSLVKIYGAASIAMIAENSDAMIGICKIAKEQAIGNKIMVVSDQLSPVQFKWSATTMESELTLLRTLLTAAKLTNPDVMIGCVYQTTCVQFVRLMKELNFSPKAIGLTTCVGDPTTVAQLGDLAKYVMGSSQWDSRLRGDTYAEPIDSPYSIWPVNISGDTQFDVNTAYSPALYSQEFYSRAGHPSSYQIAGMMAAMMMIHIGIQRSNSTVPSAVLVEIGRIYDPSFYGLLSQDRFGQNVQHELTTLQYFDDLTLQVLTPLGSADNQPIYPMPTWDERTYNPVLFGTSAEKAIIGLVVIWIVVFVGLVAFFTHHREAAVMKASGYGFCMACLIGVMIGVLSVLVWPIESNPGICTMRHWLLPLGFAALFSPLIAKTRRLSIIFNSIQLTRVMDKDLPRKTLVFAIGVVVPAVVLCALWHIVDPLQPEVRISDPLRPSKNVTTCSSGVAGNWIMGILITYLILLLLYTLQLSFSIRNVFVEFNEARQLATALYIFSFTIALVLGLEVTSAINNNTLGFIIRSIGVQLAFALFALILFVPKIVAIINKERPDQAMPKTMTHAVDPQKDYMGHDEQGGASGNKDSGTGSQNSVGPMAGISSNGGERSGRWATHRTTLGGAGAQVIPKDTMMGTASASTPKNNPHGRSQHNLRSHKSMDNPRSPTSEGANHHNNNTGKKSPNNTTQVSVLPPPSPTHQTSTAGGGVASNTATSPMLVITPNQATSPVALGVVTSSIRLSGHHSISTPDPRQLSPQPPHTDDELSFAPPNPNLPSSSATTNSNVAPNSVNNPQSSALSPPVVVSLISRDSSNVDTTILPSSFAPSNTEHGDTPIVGPRSFSPPLGNLTNFNDPRLTDRTTTHGGVAKKGGPLQPLSVVHHIPSDSSDNASARAASYVVSGLTNNPAPTPIVAQ